MLAPPLHKFWSATGSTVGVEVTVTEEVVLLQPVAVSVKVNVTIPPVRPVTTPALVTEKAMAPLLLIQVPPVVGVRLRMVVPVHNPGPPVVTTVNRVDGHIR